MSMSSSQKPPTDDPLPVRTLRILHLEDNPLDAELVSAHLADGGLTCEICLVDAEREFAAALDRGPLDLILADYNLPSFDGLSALKITLRVCPEIPFLFVSGAIGEEQAIETLKAGAVDYVLKQRLQRLVPSVRRAIREAEDRIQRRRAEASLRESEDRLRLATEAGGIGVWNWDIAYNELVWSEKCKTLFGLPPDARISNDIFARILHPDDRQVMEESFRLCLEQHKDYNAEYRIVWPDGGVHWMLDKGRAFYDPSGRAVRVHGVVMDITERRQAEKAREEHLARLDALVQVSKTILSQTTVDGVLQRIVDAARDLSAARLGICGHGFADGTFRVCVTSKTPSSPDFPPGTVFLIERGGVYMEIIEKRMPLRLTDEQLRAHPSWWGLPDWHLPLRGLLAAPLIGRDGLAAGLIMLSDKAHGKFSAEDEATLVQLAAIGSLGLQHIEARNDAERRADELAAVFASLVQPVVILDAAGKVLKANPAAERIYGKPFVGMDRLELAAGLRMRHRTGQPPADATLPSSVALQGRTVLNEPFTMVDAAGQELTVLVSGSPLLSAGQVIGSVSTWHDVTERERAQEALRQAHDQLEIRVRQRTHELAQANAALQAEIAERTRAQAELLRVNKALRILTECNQILVRSTSEEHLLHAICQAAVEFGGYNMVWVGRAEQDEVRTVRPIAWAGCDDGYLDTLQVTWADTRLGRGPTGRAIRTGQLVVQRNLARSPDFEPWRDDAVKRNFHSAVAVPLAIDGHIFGAVSIYSADPDAFDDAEVRLMQELADDLAFGLSAIRLRVERQKAVEALQASEERYRRIVETAEEGIWVLDDADTTTFINQKMAQMLGYTVEEILGSPILSFVDQRDRGAVEHALQRRRAGIKDSHDIRFRRRDGSELWVILAGAPILDEAGRYQGALKMTTDITERKRLERAIVEVSSLEQQRIGRDLHDVLGQNLTGISFLSKILEQKLAFVAMPESQDAVEIGRLATLTNKQARALAQGLSPVELTAVNFSARIKEFAVGIQEIFSISCACQCDPRVVVPDDDTAVHLYRIAQEAVNNAVKHGKARNIMIQLTEEAGRGMLMIQDDGHGMPKENEKHNGMGLRIMGYRASAIGGQLRIRSNANHGTVVICSFGTPAR